MIQTELLAQSSFLQALAIDAYFGLKVKVVDGFLAAGGVGDGGRYV